MTSNLLYTDEEAGTQRSPVISSRYFGESEAEPWVEHKYLDSWSKSFGWLFYYILDILFIHWL